MTPTGLHRRDIEAEGRKVVRLGGKQILLLANGGRHGLHELDAGRGQTLALLVDRIIHGQQFIQSERGAHRRDARTFGFSAAHVVQQIVQKLDGRVLQLGKRRFARVRVE